MERLNDSGALADILLPGFNTRYAARQCEGDPPELLFVAGEDVETEVDHHLYHTRGLCRELWLHSLGLPALPPTEDQKDLESGIGAVPARAAN